MRRIDLDYIIIAGLLLSGMYVSITGMMTDLLGLQRFAFHRYAGYLSAALATLHVALNWGRIKAYLGWKLRTLWNRKSAGKYGNPSSLSRRSFLLSALAAVGGFILGRFSPTRSTADQAEPATDLGMLYHKWSTPGYTLALGAISNWGGKPARYKTYENAQKFALPDPRGYRGLHFEEAIDLRRSRRDYSGEPLSLEDLSRLLHAAQGITHLWEAHRTAPSAGALYPIELYAVVNDVSGLTAGIYHYAVQKHELELLSPGDFRAAVMQAGAWQDFLAQGNVCIVLSSIFQRTRWKYQERTYRYVLLEAGHIGQNLYLAATSMGLGACAVGAFLDNDLNDLLGLDGQEEAAIYLLSVGRV